MPPKKVLKEWEDRKSKFVLAFDLQSALRQYKLHLKTEVERYTKCNPSNSFDCHCKAVMLSELVINNVAIKIDTACGEYLKIRSLGKHYCYSTDCTRIFWRSCIICELLLISRLPLYIKLYL